MYFFIYLFVKTCIFPLGREIVHQNAKSLLFIWTSCTWIVFTIYFCTFCTFCTYHIVNPPPVHSPRHYHLLLQIQCRDLLRGNTVELPVLSPGQTRRITSLIYLSGSSLDQVVQKFGNLCSLGSSSICSLGGLGSSGIPGSSGRSCG